MWPGGAELIRQAYCGLLVPLNVHLFLLTANWTMLHSVDVPAFRLTGRGL